MQSAFAMHDCVGFLELARAGFMQVGGLILH